MRIKANKDPGLTLFLSDEEARLLKGLVANLSPKETHRREDFKRELYNVLTKEGVEL